MSVVVYNPDINVLCEYNSDEHVSVDMINRFKSDHESLKLADWQLNLPMEKKPKKNYIEQRTMEEFLRGKVNGDFFVNQLAAL